LLSVTVAMEVNGVGTWFDKLLMLRASSVVDGLVTASTHAHLVPSAKALTFNVNDLHDDYDPVVCIVSVILGSG
jgi:hypothetical protein